MISKDLLLSDLTKKFNNLTLHTIVNECFVRGLPMDISSISSSEKRELTKYSYDVLNTLGGFKVLESAIVNCEGDENKTFLLGSIYNVCTEASKEAAKRICKETDCDDPMTDYKSVVDKAAFTDAEYKKFVSKADGIGADEISNIIKEKTLNVIKDEQEQYEKEEELDQELKDALDNSEDFSGTSNESYMDMFLDKTAPRHHMTVFSKLQESAMEMLSVVPVSSEEDVFPVVRKITFEAFMGELKNPQKAMESDTMGPERSVDSVPSDCKGKMCTLVSIIVYTIMETLKTMNLYCPAQGDIQSFVNRPMNGMKIAIEDIDHVIKKAEGIVKESAKLDFSKMRTTDLTTKLTQLRDMADAVQESCRTQRDPRVTTIVTNIDAQISNISDVLNERNLEMKKKASATESFTDGFYHKSDIAQFNRIGSLFGKDPNVSEIRLEVDPHGISSAINVTCANESHQCIKKSFMHIEKACEQTEYVDYLASLYKESKLSDSDKTVVIVPTDGFGKRYVLEK